MEYPLWLPPLNSHGNFTTHVSVSQPAGKPMCDQECSEKSFLIKVYVDVNFSSGLDQNTLKGLSVVGEFLAPCSFMINSSQEDVKKYVADILCYLRVPFGLDHIRFTEKYPKKPASKMLKRICHLSPENADSWVLKLQQFLHVMTQESHNVGHNVMPIELKIEKEIMITPNEFGTWISWFREKERVDPNFGKAYHEAVCRARTIEELLEAENSHLKPKRAEKSALLATLQDASIGGESTNWQCMVCLENLSAGCEASRLPCSHIFHKACIHKWLQESNMCPLCRSALASKSIH